MAGSEGTPLPILPYDNDDDLIATVREDGQPHLSVYPYPTTAVVLGRGGKPTVELRTEAILADGVPLFKRAGGGCAVVLDRGNVIVSAALPLPGIGGVKSAFRWLSDRLIDALANLGVPEVEQRGVSDLTLGDRKIGGSCIYRTRGLLYYTTTLLVNPDLDLVGHYLQHPPREPEYRKRRSHKEFMGRLRDHLDGIEVESFAASLATVLEIDDCEL